MIPERWFHHVPPLCGDEAVITVWAGEFFFLQIILMMFSCQVIMTGLTNMQEMYSFRYYQKFSHLAITEK